MHYPTGDHPFTFIHIPGTGGSGMEEALAQYLLGKSVAELSEAEAEKHLLPYPERTWQHARMGDAALASPPGSIFAFVRNPWEWAVSEVAYFKQHHETPFVEWTWKEGLLAIAEGKLDNKWGHLFKLQITALLGKNGQPAVDWVGRYERMEPDFAATCTRLGLPEISLGAHEVAKEGLADYRSFYDDESREAIGRAFRCDAQLFGYSFDGPSEPSGGLLEGETLREKWLEWLRGEKLSTIGWRKSRPVPTETWPNAEKYVGLKHWGWYLDDAPRWAEFLYSEVPVRVLEIGTFDGVSANLMLDYLFPHHESSLHTIDPYLPDPTTPQVDGNTEAQFHRNCETSGHPERLHHYKGLSSEVLAWMTAADEYWESFDFIYVDGSHLAKDVFMDAAMSWNLLKCGGVIGFDDYHWGNPHRPTERPQLAIDAFEACFADRIGLLFDGARRFYRKLKS